MKHLALCLCLLAGQSQAAGLVELLRLRAVIVDVLQVAPAVQRFTKKGTSLDSSPPLAEDAVVYRDNMSFKLNEHPPTFIHPDDILPAKSGCFAYTSEGQALLYYTLVANQQLAFMRLEDGWVELQYRRRVSYQDTDTLGSKARVVTPLFRHQSFEVAVFDGYVELRNPSGREKVKVDISTDCAVPFVRELSGADAYYSYGPAYTEYVNQKRMWAQVDGLTGKAVSEPFKTRKEAELNTGANQ